MPSKDFPLLSTVHLSWEFGDATMQSLGAMLGPVSFRLPDGRRAEPLHVAPWADEDLGDQPPILQHLRGEWPCVPFGIAPDAALPKRWQMAECKGDQPIDIAGTDPHGFGSNNHWRIAKSGTHSLSAEIDYPDTSAISQIRRVISANPDRPELTIELSITARRDCQIPIGIHPVFALPPEPGSIRLDVGNYTDVHSHPLQESNAITLFEPDHEFADLRQLPAIDGTRIDASQLPFGDPSETLLMLSDSDGKVRLTNQLEGYTSELEWDPEVFPSLMLWISNRGRTQHPWSSRHLALGIEPVCAAFDLGETISTSHNPLNEVGIATAWPFKAGKTLTTRYSLRVV